MAAAQAALHYPRRRLTLTLDDGPPQTFDAYQVLVANGGCYAGRFSLGPDVLPDDGLLDVFVCLRRDPFAVGVADDSLALMQDRLHRSACVRHFRARRIALDADMPMPIEIDGDAAGETPAVIEIVPGALRVLAPAG